MDEKIKRKIKSGTIIKKIIITVISLSLIMVTLGGTSC